MAGAVTWMSCCRLQSLVRARPGRRSVHKMSIEQRAILGVVSVPPDLFAGLDRDIVQPLNLLPIEHGKEQGRSGRGMLQRIPEELKYIAMELIHCRWSRRSVSTRFPGANRIHDSEFSF